MKYDGILFDLDGTLWNSTESLAVSWAEALKNIPDVPKAPTVEELEGVMGMTAENLVATLFPYLTKERGLEVFDACCQAENEYLRAHGGKLYEGVAEILMSLSEKLPLFIVSNCNDGYIPSFLEAHGLEPYFRDWEYIGRTGKEKWENIRLVVERNGLKRPVYVGDTLLDQESARLAGVSFIHADYGFGKVENAVELASPLQLSELI